MGPSPTEQPTEQPAVEVTRGPSFALRLLYALTIMQVVLVFAQAAFAGQFLSGESAVIAWHRGNANLIGILGLAQLAVALVAWRRRGPAWPTGVSALLYGAVLLQINLGYSHRIAYHVPIGVAIFGLSAVLLSGLRRLARNAQAAR